MIILKRGQDLERMRAACRLAGLVRDEVAQRIAPGMTTREVEAIAGERIRAYGAKSAFLGYRRYPCQICISVNEEVVHGLASDRRLKFGDIVSLDVGVRYEGFVGDTARTVAVGGCDLTAQKLLDVTEQSLYQGIAQARAGNRVVDISRAVQTFVEGHGFSVVRELVGHGVGRAVHEDPQVPNFVDDEISPPLRPGMTLAIEPMVNAGTREVRVLKDGWTVVTRDARLSAHFEHTVLITEAEPEIMTCCDQTPSA